MTNGTEIWKEIPGYDGMYELSNLGRVKRIGYVTVDKNGMVRKFNDRILKISYVDSVNEKYPIVRLEYNGKYNKDSIDRLMHELFTSEVDTITEEIWKYIPGYNNNYMVSNLGRIKSFMQNNISGRIMKPISKNYNNGGNKFTIVSLYDNGKPKKHVGIARLVYTTFIGETELNIRFRDNDNFNCRLDNLYVY